MRKNSQQDMGIGKLLMSVYLAVQGRESWSSFVNLIVTRQEHTNIPILSLVLINFDCLYSFCDLQNVLAH